MPPEPDPKTHSVVYTGLPGDGLEDFIRMFSGAATADPFGTWLILPTNRLVGGVIDHLSGAGVPVVSSHVCTLSDFCRHFFEEHRTSTRLLTKAESGLLLSRVLDENKIDLPSFTRSRPSSGTIDELRQFISVVTRRKIAFPECLIDLQSTKSDQIDLISTSYHNLLRELDLLDADTILEWTIDQISSPDQFGHVFVYGLFEPEPLEQDLLSAIRTHCSEFSGYVPTGSDPKLFRKSESWLADAGNVIPVLPSSPVSESLTGLFAGDGIIDTAGKIHLASFPSRDRELVSIAEEICRLRESGVHYSAIAVAFPDVREKIPVVEEVFDDFGIPWTSATGHRLSRSPIIGFVTGILKLVDDRYPREDVIRLAGNPYFPRYADLNIHELDLVSRLAQIEGEKSGWLHGLARYLSRVSDDDRKDKDVHANERVERVIPGISPLFEDLKPLEGKKSVQEFRKNLSDLMDRWGLDPDANAKSFSNDERAALHAFRNCLTGLDRTTGLLADEKVTAREFLSILSALIKETTVAATTTDSGVSVVGIRECEHEHFPVLFLTGLIEGEIPQLTTRLPFTNTRENARMGTRTLDEILREGRYYFLAALLAGRDRLYLSAPLSDGDKLLLTSAFFERVKERTNAGEWGAEPVLSHSLHANAVRAGTMIASGEVCESLGVMPEEYRIDELVGRVNIDRYHRTGEYDSPYEGMFSGDSAITGILSTKYGPDHVWSPTILETYASCPFRFFLERVIGIKPLPDVEPNLSAKDRGTAVHAVLSTFYREWRASGRTKVTGSNLAEATELMLRIAAVELDRFSFESPLWDATRIQMTGGNETGPGIFSKFLVKESEEECSALVPSLFEFSFGMPATPDDDPASVPEPVGFPVGEEMIRIKGRVDRIDVTPDGFFSICDYKTGSAVVSGKDIKEGKALQLPLYLSAYEQLSGKRGVAASYYRIRREVENKVVLLDEVGRDLICSSRPRATPDFRDLLHHTIESAVESVRGIRSGVFPIVQEEKCPNAYCEFRFICRFDPARVFSLNAEVD